MPRKTSPAWLSYALKRGNISKSRLQQAGLTSRAIETFKRSKKLSPFVYAKLRSAYLKTQYNKLRRAGYNKHEAMRYAYIKKPSEIVQSVNDRRSYVDEMILRKQGIGTSRREWARARKAIIENIKKSPYTDSAWAAFAEWYSKHMSKKYPKGRRKVATLKPTPDVRKIDLKIPTKGEEARRLAAEYRELMATWNRRSRK